MIYNGRKITRLKNKYGNIKIESSCGKKFDSKKEMGRYHDLKMLEKIGEIKDLELQPKFILQEKFKYQGKTQRAITYTPDFSYINNKNNKYTVEDVKGFDKKTGKYIESVHFKIKKKLFLKKYPFVDFRIV